MIETAPAAAGPNKGNRLKIVLLNGTYFDLTIAPDTFSMPAFVNEMKGLGHILQAQFFVPYSSVLAIFQYEEGSEEMMKSGYPPKGTAPDGSKMQ